MATFIQKEINEQGVDDPAFLEFLNGITEGQGKCVQLLETLLPKIVLNLEKYRLTTINGAESKYSSLDPIARLLLFIISEMHNDFETVDLKLKQLDKNLSENELKETTRLISLL